MSHLAATVVLLSLAFGGTAPAEELVLSPVVGGPPNGVAVGRLPHTGGFDAHGEAARDLVRRAMHRPVGDPEVPDRVGVPWLVLIGPEDATQQVVGQLPDDVAGPLGDHVVRYRPDDPRLDRGFKRYYGGGTHAIVLGPDRKVVWEGLIDLAEIVHHLRRLLGLEPDAKPLIPLPGGPDGDGLIAWLISWIPGGNLTVGLLVGLFGKPALGRVLRLLILLGRDRLREFAREVLAEEPATKKAAPKRPESK